MKKLSPIRMLPMISYIVSNVMGIHHLIGDRKVTGIYNLRGFLSGRMKRNIHYGKENFNKGKIVMKGHINKGRFDKGFIMCNDYSFMSTCYFSVLRGIVGGFLGSILGKVLMFTSAQIILTFSTLLVFVFLNRTSYIYI